MSEILEKGCEHLATRFGGHRSHEHWLAHVRVLTESPGLRGLVELIEAGCHTNECLNYAVKTALAHGNYHCIAKCADARHAALRRFTDG